MTTEDYGHAFESSFELIRKATDIVETLQARLHMFQRQRVESSLWTEEHENNMAVVENGLARITEILTRS